MDWGPRIKTTPTTPLKRPPREKTQTKCPERRLKHRNRISLKAGNRYCFRHLGGGGGDAQTPSTRAPWKQRFAFGGICLCICETSRCNVLLFFRVSLRVCVGVQKPAKSGSTDWGSAIVWSCWVVTTKGGWGSGGALAPRCSSPLRRSQLRGCPMGPFTPMSMFRGCQMLFCALRFTLTGNIASINFALQEIGLVYFCVVLGSGVLAWSG